MEFYLVLTCTHHIHVHVYYRRMLMHGLVGVAFSRSFLTFGFAIFVFHASGCRSFMGCDMGLGVFVAEARRNRIAIHQVVGLGPLYCAGVSVHFFGTARSSYPSPTSRTGTGRIIWPRLQSAGRGRWGLRTGWCCVPAMVGQGWSRSDDCPNRVTHIFLLPPLFLGIFPARSSQGANDGYRCIFLHCFKVGDRFPHTTRQAPTRHQYTPPAPPCKMMAFF